MPTGNNTVSYSGYSHPPPSLTGPSFTYRNNPVYGPPPPQPRPSNGQVNNSIYTPNASAPQPPTYAQAAQSGIPIANPLTQFMSGVS